ncbi:MAG TPA: hypothetical protein VNZ86_10750 [Bacteroidia bacterium]|jgi:hypothetical protein|nr:hypothetical protein [Bacteroidia bacterium]
MKRPVVFLFIALLSVSSGFGQDNTRLCVQKETKSKGYDVAGLMRRLKEDSMQSARWRALSRDLDPKGCIDSIEKDLKQTLSRPWAIKRFDKRLVIYRTDSSLLLFDPPLQPAFNYDTSTVDGMKSWPKYSAEIYLDFVWGEWSEAMLQQAGKHNANVRDQIKTALKGMDEHPDNRIAYRQEITLLRVQLMDIPEVHTSFFDVFVKNNKPFGSSLIKVEGEDGNGHLSLSGEMSRMQVTCIKVVKSWTEKIYPTH